MIPVKRIGLSKAQLATLPPDERSLLVGVGHGLNQILMMLKLTSFSSSHTPAHPVEAVVSAAQSHAMLRLLIGTLAETLVWLNRPANHRLVGKTYLPTLPEQAQQSYAAVKRRFGKDGQLQAVRNRFAFHYPSQENFDAAFRYAPEDEDWSLYQCDNLTNSMWLSSELVMGFGMISASGFSDPTAGFTHLMAEAMEVTNAMTDFLMNLGAAMLLRHFDIEVLHPELVAEVQGAPAGKDYWLPFYFEPPFWEPTKPAD